MPAELNILLEVISAKSLGDIVGSRSRCSLHVIDYSKFLLLRILFDELSYKPAHLGTSLPTLQILKAFKAVLFHSLSPLTNNE